MGSFGMDWNQKSSVLWDWENMLPVGNNTNENPKNVMQAESKLAGVGVDIGHESAHSSGGTFSSSSEIGYGSSKSSISVSIDSPSKVGNTIELNFASVKEPGRNMGKGKELCKVDDTGTSRSPVVAASQAEPLIGLKLGKRTYFEDVCGGQNVKGSPSSGVSVATPSPGQAKKAKVAQQNASNTYCQVEGCNVDLSSAKPYHRKHRVCEPHSKTPKVIVAGLERRFCQQCSRFHGLNEFDQKKKSCRRRLNDHNARRRKPQPEAISLSSSRLSTILYGDARQQTGLLFGQAPYGQMGSYASSLWDNPAPGGFKFTATKAPWSKPTRAAGVDGTRVSNHQASSNVLPHEPHHSFDSLMAFKETNAKVLNQGMEASAVASSSAGGPDFERALSPLSINSVGAANLQPGSQMHPGVTAIAGTSNPAMMPSPAIWQGNLSLDQQAQFQAFDRLSNDDTAAPHQLQLPKPSYDNSHYDQMN
uniref:SBP-type domain-containing protein n=1 Tax=Leersia perrieri TaxID=77586 RepID=A0A0D9VC29_9ORYZ